MSNTNKLRYPPCDLCVMALKHLVLCDGIHLGNCAMSNAYAIHMRDIHGVYK